MRKMTVLSPAEQLHASPWIGVLYITGGGISMLNEMLATPGASQTILEASVPYAATALSELLGRVPDQAASTATARALAMAAFKRGQQLQLGQNFGLGVTASLTTKRPKKGQTRAYWAIQTATASHSFSVILAKELSRQEQELSLNRCLWQTALQVLLGQSSAEETNKSRMGSNPTAPIQADSVTAPASWQRLLQQPGYQFCTQQHDGQLLLPGSFNPVHDGHRQMLAAAEAITGLNGAFELTLRNADKPDLDYLSLQERLAKMADTPVWLTNLTSFADKAEAFPGTIFALGTDTMARIAQPRFYDDNPVKVEQALATLKANKVRFLVFGRRQAASADSPQRFTCLEDLSLPDALTALCDGVPEDQFRSDLSSTDLRRSDAQSSN